MNSISDHLTVTTPLPRYLPYARFLLDTDLSHTAKLLYILLLDRATLSQKNNWIDAQGRIYVLYPLSSLAKDLGCSISSITRAFAELADFVSLSRHLLAPEGCWLAMKGVWPRDEIDRLPGNVHVAAVHALTVPGVDAERHLVVMRRAATE